jgi:Xaa-Pro dipeptidase
VTEIEAAVLVQRPTWMPEVKMYFFGIYGGVLKVHTFHDRDALTGEDRAISDMVAHAERTGYAGIAEAASAAIRERGLGGARIGLDDTRFAGLLGDTLSNASVVDATNLLLEIRMVKTADEIAILREAARKNQRAMEAAIAAIRDGATWYEVSNAYEIEVARQGARVFASFNGAGLRSAGAARPDARYPIQPGDQVCFDSMLKWRRYMGDAQRSVVLGEAPLRLRKAWDAYAAGIAEAYDTLRPGIATGELRDRTIRTVRANGLPSFELAFSHGIGLDHIEVPFIAGGTLGDFPVQRDMVLNIDMELHEIGWGGLFFEESMLVTATGAERLYTLPRALIEV